MLNEEEWRELTSKKLELEYQNQLKISGVLDLIEQYMKSEIKKEES